MRSVITFSTTAKTNDEVITPLTEAMAESILPHIALASIAKIIFIRMLF